MAIIIPIKKMRVFFILFLRMDWREESYEGNLCSFGMVIGVSFLCGVNVGTWETVICDSLHWKGAAQM